MNAAVLAAGGLALASAGFGSFGFLLAAASAAQIALSLALGAL